MRHLRLKKNDQGFTLVEILISMTIFGILMVAFLSLFTGAYFMTLRAGDRDKTLAGITGKVENKIASTSYDDPADPDQITWQSNQDVTVIYDSGPQTVKVDITTGIAQMQDGTEVEINYFKPTGP